MSERNPFEGGHHAGEDEFRISDLRRSGLPPNSGRWLLGGIVILALLWLASGFYVVSPGQQGIVRQFGREYGKSGPGLRYRLPSPIQTVDVVSVEAIRRIEVGFRTGRDGRATRVNSEALMLTGDENIVEAQVIVQYRVSDPSSYLFRLSQPDEALRAATEVSLRSVVGGMVIDDVLTVGRALAEAGTRDFLQRLMDSYESGISVTDVKLQVVDPPEQVKDAFHEVVRAREDREKVINEARGYTEDILPKARGQAQEMLRGAEAYRERRVIEAQGDSAKFVSVLLEYAKAKDVTRSRMHLEVLERVLAKTDKILMDSSSSGNLLPFLPLRGAQQQTVPSTAPAPQPAQPAQPAPTPRPAVPQPAPAPAGR